MHRVVIEVVVTRAPARAWTEKQAPVRLPRLAQLLYVGGGDGSAGRP